MGHDKRLHPGFCAWCTEKVGERWYVILPSGDPAWVCPKCEKRLGHIRARLANEKLNAEKEAAQT